MDYFLAPKVVGMPLSDTVVREDGAWIPADPDNMDWVEYQSWLAAGNQPRPYDEYVPIVPQPKTD